MIVFHTIRLTWLKMHQESKEYFADEQKGGCEVEGGKRRQMRGQVPRFHYNLSWIRPRTARTRRALSGLVCKRYVAEDLGHIQCLRGCVWVPGGLQTPVGFALRMLGGRRSLQCFEFWLLLFRDSSTHVVFVHINAEPFSVPAFGFSLCVTSFYFLCSHVLHFAWPVCGFWASLPFCTFACVFLLFLLFPSCACVRLIHVIVT